MVKHEAGTIAESNKNLSNVHPAVVLSLDLTFLHKQNDSMSLILLCAN